MLSESEIKQEIESKFKELFTNALKNKDALSERNRVIHGEIAAFMKCLNIDNNVSGITYKELRRKAFESLPKSDREALQKEANDLMVYSPIFMAEYY